MIDEKRLIARVIEELRRQGDNKLADEVEKPKGMTFKLTPKQVDKFRKWDESHIAEKHEGKEPYAGAIGGRLTFRFTGTSIGTIEKVSCASCGEDKDLSEYESW